MKRGGPLKRKTPLHAKPRPPGEPQRKAYMRAKPARRIAERMEDRPFVAWIHNGAPCHFQYREISGRIHVCTGAVEGSHMGPKPGMALKAPDTTMVRMCSGLHHQWTVANGLFKGWTKGMRRSFADDAIAQTQRLWSLYQEAAA
jgi:hypothetical protein